MRRFKSAITRSIAICSLLIAGVSCAQDDNFGSGFLPGGQKMDVQQSDFKWRTSDGFDAFSVRLFNTTQHKMSNVGRVSIGAERDSLFGDRRSGFYSQYTPLKSLTESGFGVDAMLDSVMFYFNIYEYHGNITETTTYEVREVLNDDFIRNSTDTLFSSISVDSMVAAGILGDVLFEFDYPDANHPIDYDTDSIGAKVITPAGHDLIDGLMLKQRGNGSQVNYEIYNNNHKIFLDNFKGLSLMPKAFSTEPTPSGATYGIVLEMSGWGFYGRSKVESDPSLIKDTVSMTYVFRDASLYDPTLNPDYLESPGGVSINLIERDFSSAKFDESMIGNENNSATVTSDTMFIEGMGGVVSEITLEKSLFEELDRVIATRNSDLGEDFNNLFINSARLQLYVMGMKSYSSVMDGSYLPDDIYSVYNTLPARLGLYRNFGTMVDEAGATQLIAVSDYNYQLEIANNTYTDYDGGLNRSRGCYEMNIHLHMQGLWRQWRDAVAAAGGDSSAVDWSTITWNKIYVAPLAEDLFTVHRLMLQGSPNAGSEEGAPIRLQLTYTLVKS